LGKYGMHRFVGACEALRFWRRKRACWRIPLVASRYAQRAQAIVTGKVQKIQKGVARRPVEQADDAPPPLIRPYIVYGAAARCPSFGTNSPGSRGKSSLSANPLSSQLWLNCSDTHFVDGTSRSVPTSLGLRGCVRHHR